MGEKTDSKESGDEVHPTPCGCRLNGSIFLGNFYA